MKTFLKSRIAPFLLLLMAPFSQAADSSEHQLVQKIVVFPIYTHQSYVNKIEDAWWKMREKLADDRRFLVAKKSYMQQKDVYQPREKLDTPDAILLGKLLDADALIVTDLDGRDLRFKVYSGRDGFVLWSKEMKLHPSLPIDKQIEAASVDLLDQFVASFPYQGYQIIDPLVGKPVYEEGDIQLAKVEVSQGLKVQPGDTVNWIQVHRLNNKPLFINGSQITVFAEGEVVKRERGVLTVKINRLKDSNLLQKDSLVAFPQESKRLQALLDESTRLSVDIVRSPMDDPKTQKSETKPLLTALASVANIALLILLAF